jgi:hypothetical protein
MTLNTETLSFGPYDDQSCDVVVKEPVFVSMGHVRCGIGGWILGTGSMEQIPFFITQLEMKYRMRPEIAYNQYPILDTAQLSIAQLG